MTADSGTVYVVDDDEGVRKAVTRLLRAAGFEVHCFPLAAEYLAKDDRTQVGCLLLDVAMPGISGLDLQEALATTESERSIVFITGRGDIPKSVQAMKAGAIDFLTKPLDDEKLLAAVRLAIEKDQLARRARAERESIEQRLATLTQREREVLEHVVSGELNKQIAAKLGTVEKTIKVHRGRVMAKMGVDSVAELVRVTEQAGVRPAASLSSN
jgi:FixJ family two-component response regulator